MARRAVGGPNGRVAVQLQINNLPKRTDFELLGIWNNLNRGIRGRSDAATPLTHLEMRSALEREWQERSLRPDLTDWFRWPSTDVIMGDGTLHKTLWPTEGVLSAVGYHVGITNGRIEAERRWLLDHVFCRTLPPIVSPSYMRQWDDPGTPKRLHKMADVIAASSRNAKHRRSSALDLACEQWEADLAYLRARYYVGRFRFGWPAVV